MQRNTIAVSDALAYTQSLPDGSVDCIITSPPYFGLRSYLDADDPDKASEYGNEDTIEAYVARMVALFAECRRALKNTGVLFLNLGDSYGDGKQLLGVPWEVAKALQKPVYGGLVPLERDRVWLAAILEAEGTVCGFAHTRKDDGRTRTGIHIMITNSSMAILDECQRIWPASIVEHGRPGRGHIGELETYRWLVQGVDTKIALIRELLPYVISKRKQMILAYNLLLFMADATRLGRSEQANRIRDKRLLLTRLISDTNHAIDIDIPDWCEMPPPIENVPGYILRSDIIWHKPNPMPSSQTDRCTVAHEYVFMLTKRPRYWYDAEAVREPSIYAGKRVSLGEKSLSKGQARGANVKPGGNALADYVDVKPYRNKRSVWGIPSEQFPGAHFATFPTKLIEPMVLAGCPARVCAVCGAPWERITEVEYQHINYTKPREHSSYVAKSSGQVANKIVHTKGWRPTCECQADIQPGLVYDPFMGSGTVALVARRHKRDYIGCDLNAEYVDMALDRLRLPFEPRKVKRENDMTGLPLFDEEAR